MQDEAQEPGAGSQPKPARATKAPSKTPAFQAMHSSRYRRQDLIRAIEQKTGRQLICYVAGLHTMISRDDVVFLVDLLHNARRGEDLDLLLHTGGGDYHLVTYTNLVVNPSIGDLKLDLPRGVKTTRPLKD